MENFFQEVGKNFKASVRDVLVEKIKKDKKIFIGDTTLRDGEQAPGAALTVKQKLIIAKQLERLGVDSIEAGFPISSRDDFEAVKLISEEVKHPVITALCRSKKEDIDCAREALKKARKCAFSLFLATSPILRKYSLRKNKSEIIDIVKEAVSYARNFTDNISFAAEDASRTEPEFLYEVYRVAIDAGALVVGFADTVGYLVPDEIGDVIAGIRANVPSLDKAFLGAHFHNDLGLAVANALAAVKSGVNIIQCTVNGIGERAGNTSLEEVVMALKTKNKYYGVKIGIKTEELFKTSQLVAELTGLAVPNNKPIVGKNVFATEAGIHQAALLKNRLTYEIIKPESVGQAGTRIVLGKHSGKHALINRIKELHIKWPAGDKDEKREEIYNRFKELAGTKKIIEDEDLVSIISQVNEETKNKHTIRRNEGMKNLVTGGTGFIGSFIAENLVKRGEYVRALARKTSDTTFLKSLGVEIFYGDLNDPASMREAVRGMDKVFHSAAMVGDWIDSSKAYGTNVEGTRNLIEASLDEKIKRFVFVSSLGVLGMKDQNHTPSDAPRVKVGDPYIDTKVEAEEIVAGYGKERNLPFTVIRPGFVFGPRDTKVIPGMASYIKRGKFMFIGSGKNKINMIYVENLADAVVKASYSDKTLNQIYNITNDSNMTMMDMVYLISDMWGYKRPTTHMPKPAAYMLCNTLEFFARASHAKKAPLLNKTRLKFLSLNLDFDITKIKNDLNYAPSVDMKEGLRRTKEWIEVNIKK